MTQENSLDLLTKPIKGQQVFAVELPEYDFLRHCVRCARCLPVCPTYQETQIETQSPRGRLSLIKAVEEGGLAFNKGVEEHLYHCLDCRMCNTVCPASVPIGESIIAARAAFGERLGRPWWRKLVFRQILISAHRLGWVLWPLRIYQRYHVDKIMRPILQRLPRPLSILQRMEALLPQLQPKALHNTLPEIIPAKGHRKHRVGFFLGCMMSQLLTMESQATVDVLAHFNCEVVTPKGQLCCGAPHDDQGERAHARRFARHNIDLFDRYPNLDVIVSDCAACSGMLKEYGELLHDDARYSQLARVFSQKIMDIYEWYDHLGIKNSSGNKQNPRRVTIHDACHLANAQGITRPQRNLLNRMTNVQVAEMCDPSACCGSAGIYNLTHPQMANTRLNRKLENIAATGADVVVTNGPGCLLQLRAARQAGKTKAEVKHISELIIESIHE